MRFGDEFFWTVRWCFYGFLGVFFPFSYYFVLVKSCKDDFLNSHE